MDPSCGVKEIQATVRLESKRWLPVDQCEEGSKPIAETDEVGDGWKRTGRLVNRACVGKDSRETGSRTVAGTAEERKGTEARQRAAAGGRAGEIVVEETCETHLRGS